MSTPGSTDNPGQMLPIRMMAKCTDGGTNDGKWVDLTCTSDGQLQSSSSSADARILTVAAPFPDSSLTLAPGKIITYQSFTGLFPAIRTPFIVELVNVVDNTHAGLDLDIYFDVSPTHVDWVGTVAEGSYAYVSSFADSGVAGLCKVRSTDYATQYSGAGAAAASHASKPIVLSGSSSGLEGADGISIVVVSAGSSTATISPEDLQIEFVIRTRPTL